MDDIESFRITLERGQPHVVVVGGGYVGLPLAVAIAKSACLVTVLDVDEHKVEAINEGRSYVGDVPSEALAPLVEHELLHATTNPDEAYARADVVLICVPTPLAVSREPDTSLVRAAVDTLLEQLWRTSRQLLVVLESTVYPGFTKEELADRLHGVEMAAKYTIHVAFSPERVDPANKTHGVVNTPKVVGGVDVTATRLAASFYSRFVPEVVQVSSASAAELVKLLENTFRAVNIALVNEFAIAAAKLGIDIWEVVDAAATKPYGYMKFTPGPGIGGHCINQDPPYLSWRMRGLGHEMRLLDTAMLIALAMPHYVVERLASMLNEYNTCLNGTRVLIVGVAYKPNVPDTRESPALDIIRELARRGAIVSYYDPYVPELTHEGFALRSADPTGYDHEAAIIVTDHDCFDYSKILAGTLHVLDTRGATRTLPELPPGTVAELL